MGSVWEDEPGEVFDRKCRLHPPDVISGEGRHGLPRRDQGAGGGASGEYHAVKGGTDVAACKVQKGLVQVGCSQGQTRFSLCQLGLSKGQGPVFDRAAGGCLHEGQLSSGHILVPLLQCKIRLGLLELSSGCGQGKVKVRFVQREKDLPFLKRPPGMRLGEIHSTWPPTRAFSSICVEASTVPMVATVTL